MLDHAGFHKLPKGLQITVGDVYDFVSDVNAVVTVHFLNFVNSNDVGAMNTQETFFWQHVFYSLHRQMGDKRLGLIVKIKQHIVFHAVYIDNIIDSQVPPLAIDPDEDRAWLLSLKGWRLWGSILQKLLSGFLDSGEELIITYWFQQEIEGIHFIALEGILFECGGEDHACLLKYSIHRHYKLAVCCPFMRSDVFLTVRSNISTYLSYCCSVRIFFTVALWRV